MIHSTTPAACAPGNFPQHPETTAALELCGIDHRSHCRRRQCRQSHSVPLVNKSALVVDAFAASAEHKLHFPNTGSVYRDMSLQMTQLLAILRSPRGRIVAALVGGGQSDPELLAAYRERFLRPRREEAYKTLRRAIERGELPRSLDLDLVLDILYGAIYMRFLIRHDALSEDYIRQVCRLVLGGAARRAQPARPAKPQKPLRGAFRDLAVSSSAAH